MGTIGSRIRDKRIEKQYSQEELARILQQQYDMKTSRVTVTKWETGTQEPRGYAIKCIAEILGTTADWLIRGIEANVAKPIQEQHISPNRKALLDFAETATDEQISLVLRLAKAVLEQEK